MKNISKNLFMLILALMMCAGLCSVSAFAAEEEPDTPEEHVHILLEFPAEPATCGAAGNIEYWQCEICEKYFSDPCGINEITQADTVIPATGEHSWDSGVVTVEPTYDSDGLKVYTCTVCGAVRTEAIPALVRNGFFETNGGWYYYVNGDIAGDVNSVLNGTVNGQDGWWYVVGGRVKLDYTGIADYANEYGWWYIRDGRVDFSKNSVERNKNGWWYVLGGKVDFSYTGVADYSNDYGWWYIKNGQVDFSKNSVEQNRYGWWYVLGGQVTFNFTGLANHGNDYGWWYIRGGQVDFAMNGVEQNQYGWWYVLGGQVQFGYTGVVDYTNEYGWWYVRNGQVDFTRNGIESNSYGSWYVKGGGVDFTFSGITTVDNMISSVSGGCVSVSGSMSMMTAAQSYSSGTGYLMMVDTTSNITGIFTGSRGNWSLQKYWQCSTGKSSTPTVLGQFTISDKGLYFGESEGDGAYTCWYWTRFYRDYLFHSVPYAVGSQTEILDSRLGANVSKGCVRLELSNAKWIYDNIPRGTTVVVY